MPGKTNLGGYSSIVDVTCKVVQDGDGVYKLRDSIRHINKGEKVTVQDVIQAAWGFTFDFNDANFEPFTEVEKAWKDEKATRFLTKLRFVGIDADKFFEQQAKRQKDYCEDFGEHRSKDIALAVFISTEGGTTTIDGVDVYNASEHFMCIFWLCIQGRVQFFYHDALQPVKTRVYMLQPSSKILKLEVYPSTVVDMKTDIVQRYKRNYAEAPKEVIDWLGSLRYNGHNSCPFDVALLSLLSTFHAGILCKTGVIAIPGNEEGTARDEVTSAQNFLIRLHSRRGLCLNLNAARTYLIKWMQTYHVASCATLGADGKSAVPAAKFQAGRMLDSRCTLQSLLESAAGTKIQHLMAVGSTPKEMRLVASKSLAWLKAVWEA